MADRYDAQKRRWSFDNGDLDDFESWEMIGKFLLLGAALIALIWSLFYLLAH